jgi:heme-degrading monooxygenase HmoA
MIVTVFRSRLASEAEAEYAPMAQRLSEVVRTMPGYTSHKTFVSQDGERLTFVEFVSEQALKAWAMHPAHIEAKRLGRERLFSEYRVQICKIIRDSNDRGTFRERRGSR